MAVTIAKWSCDIYCSTCGSEAAIDRNTVVADAGAGGGLPSHLLAPHASELAIPKCWKCSAGQHELVKATFADSYVTELGAGSSAESSAEASHHARKLKAKSRKVGKGLQTGGRPDPWKKTNKKTLKSPRLRQPRCRAPRHPRAPRLRQPRCSAGLLARLLQFAQPVIWPQEWTTALCGTTSAVPVRCAARATPSWRPRHPRTPRLRQPRCSAGLLARR